MYASDSERRTQWSSQSLAYAANTNELRIKAIFASPVKRRGLSTA